MRTNISLSLYSGSSGGSTTNQSTFSSITSTATTTSQPVTNSTTTSSKTTPSISVHTLFLSFALIGLLSLKLRKKRIK